MTPLLLFITPIILNIALYIPIGIGLRNGDISYINAPKLIHLKFSGFFHEIMEHTSQIP